MGVYPRIPKYTQVYIPKVKVYSVLSVLSVPNDEISWFSFTNDAQTPLSLSLPPFCALILYENQTNPFTVSPLVS